MVCTTNEIPFTSIVMSWRWKCEKLSTLNQNYTWLHTTRGKWDNMFLCNRNGETIMFQLHLSICPLSLYSLFCFHPPPLSQFILPTPPTTKLTRLRKVFRLCGAELPGWHFHIFSGWEMAPTSFRELNSECSYSNCVKHSHMWLLFVPSFLSICDNGMKLTCSGVICVPWVH